MQRSLFRNAALSLFLVVLSPCAAAQEDAFVQGHLPSQDARYVWTGRVLRDGELVVTRSELTPAEELAEIRLRIEVERDFEGALEALGDLQLRATAAGGSQRMETLVQISRERAELLIRLGRVREARAALERLFVDEAAKREQAGRYELKLAEAAERIAEVQKLLDPRLAELRARLASGELERPGGSRAGIEQAVREALGLGVPDIVLDIGPRAAPVLEELLLEQPEHFPRVEVDPLVLLLQLSELRGAALIAAHWDAGGFFWKKRIVRAMEHAEVLTNEGTWRAVGGSRTAPQLLETGWLPILARLVHDPEVGRDAISLVEIVAFNDALSPELQTGLGLALRSSDPDLVREVLRVLANTSGKRSSEAVVAVALEHPDPEVRRFACDHLLSFEPASGLLAAAEHVDPMVRGYVARALRERVVAWPTYRAMDYAPGQSRGPRTLYPVLGERELALLRELATDPVASVRREAVLALVDAPLDSVGEELWRRLAEDVDPAVRAPSAGLLRSDPESCAAVLALLAADADPDVLRAVDSRLASIADKDFDAGRELEPYLNVLAVRRANRALPMRTIVESDWVRDVFAAAVKSDAGIARVAAWALDERDDDLIALLVDEAPWRAEQSWGSNVGMGCLDDERFAALYARAFHISRDAFKRVAVGTEALRPRRGPALRRILVDATQPRSLRARAAASAAPDGGAEYRREVLSFLGEAWTERVPDEKETYGLTRIAPLLPQSERADFLLAVVNEAEIPDAIGLLVFADAAGRRALDPEVAAAVVRRWYGDPRGVRVVRSALGHLQTAPGEPLSDVLVQAARELDYYRSAVAALGRLGHDAYLEPLGACLRADWVQEENTRAEMQLQAVRALGGYLSDEAAGYLLDGLGWIRDKGVRSECFEALEAVRRYQEERERWVARKLGQSAREEAVAELLSMIEDEDPGVRSRAVRSLATLGAVEHLPEMVRLLSDESTIVRDAAQAAIELVNRGESARDQ